MFSLLPLFQLTQFHIHINDLHIFIINNPALKSFETFYVVHSKCLDKGDGFSGLIII